MENTAKVKVNFFRPVTEHARKNMKLIIILALIWAIAVFGFQVLLMVFNKPVPEDNYVKFEQLWPGFVDNETLDLNVKQELAQVSLAVLGKNVALDEEAKSVLKLAVSKLVLDILPGEQKDAFGQDPLAYLSENDLRPLLGLENDGFDKILYDLLPTSLIPVENAEFTAEMEEKIPSIMQLYLVHNRSFLTDTTFIGFPFHYWYTAQFLLILFVVLCIIYAKSTDKLHKKHKIEE